MKIQTTQLLKKCINTCQYGVFFKIDEKDHYLNNNTVSPILDLDYKSKFDKNSAVLQCQIKNSSQKIVTLKSAVLAECNLPYKLIQTLQHGWMQSSLSTYKTRATSNQKTLTSILHKNTNKLSYQKDWGFLPGSIMSEWFTLVKLKNFYLIIGAISVQHQYSQVYIKKLNSSKTKFRITCQFDGKKLYPNEKIETEKFFIKFGKNKSQLFAEYAQKIQKENNIKKIKKPIQGLCCNYYSDARNITKEYIDRQLKIINQKKIIKKNIKFFLIDAGYTFNGDWSITKKKFHYDLKQVVKKINQHGLEAGIWIAPFYADVRSNFFKKNQDIFLKNDFFATRLLNKKIANRFQRLDLSHQEARNHIFDSFKYFKECGFKLIKLDFLYPPSLETCQKMNLTRVEILRKILTKIRKITGPEIYLKSAISTLSPLVGIMDLVRTGIDTTYSDIYQVPLLRRLNNILLSENIKNSQIRSFFHRNIWNNDLDCIVYNKRSGLNQRNIKKHIQTIVTKNHSVWFGDDLEILKDKQILHLN